MGRLQDAVLPPPAHSSAPRSRTFHWLRNILVLCLCVWLAFLSSPLNKWSERPRLLESLRSPPEPLPQPPEPHPRPRGTLIKAKHGAVASEHVTCSNLGVDVLMDGGNAVDAAVATTLCIGVLNMFASGIGGGGFMLLRIPPTNASANSSVYSIDFRETAPAGSNATMYVSNPSLAQVGGLAVGVPGELRGLEEAHKRWGKLPWARVVQPSVELAEGAEVSEEIAYRIRLPFVSSLLLNDPVWSALFAPDGELLEAGDIIRRPALARTLAAVAKHGADAFYEGPIAESLISTIRLTGGILSLDDLASYRIKVDEPVKGSYRGRRIYGCPAPAAGPVLVHMLHLLERFDFSEGRTPLNVHRFVEALKFGFAARSRLGDPRYHANPAIIDEIPTRAYADKIAPNITDDRTHPLEYYNPEFDVPDDHGTSHSSIVDQDGMVVSITSTVNHLFGNQVMDPETGVIFNNEMDDFSIPGVSNGFGLYPSPHNYPAPSKRPLSSTAPLIVEDASGEFYAALGGAGGSRIFGAVTQVLLNVADWGLDLSAAIEHTRLHDQLVPRTVLVDVGYEEGVVKGLEERGHNVTMYTMIAEVQGVMQDRGYFWAASDTRKLGVAAGY